MVEHLKNNEWMNSDDLAKLQQDILSSLETHSDPEIVRELEQVKKTLESTQLSDQEKISQIKEELATLKEKGVVFEYLSDLERKVDAMLDKESINNQDKEETSPQDLLQKIAQLPNSPEKDAQITKLADDGRANSADNVVLAVESMKKKSWIRWAIGNFFSSRI